MDKYTKSDDVNRILIEHRNYCVNEHWHTGAGFVTTIYEALQNIPTADVAEVRHGEWKLDCTQRDVACYHHHFVCSLCGRKETVQQSPSSPHNPHHAVRLWYPYCHCGAKMDGGKN